MDWTPIIEGAFQVGVAFIPYITSFLMLLLGTLVWQLIGRLPAFLRVFAEKAYREKEAGMRASIERALLNGLNSAVKKGKRGEDALTEALKHAMKTNPEGVTHFTQTSGMTAETLKTQAAGLGEATGVDWLGERDPR